MQRLLEAPYTDEEAAKDLRVFHGFWTERDLDTPARRALAMLIAGNVDHVAFADERIPADLRAEAAIRRGQPELALTLTEGDGSLRAVHLRTWALSERRQYAQSAAMLEEAMRRAPNLPEPAILLGLLELQSGRDLNALAALRCANELDPFNARAVNSLRLLEELVGYHTFESEHFVVRYKPGIDEILAREMTGPLEMAHARICGKADGGRGAPRRMRCQASWA